MARITRTNWSEIAPDVLAAALPLARGCYQRNLLRGRESLSGSTLRGKAQRFGGRYAGSRRSLLGRLRGAGFRVSVRTAEHGARLLVVERTA